MLHQKYLLALLFIVTPYAYAIDGANVNKQGAGGSMNIMSSSTVTSALPANIQSFMATTSNQCAASGETRDNCFVRYAVNQLYNNGVPTGVYMLSNNNLQCPTGYYVTASFGDSIYDTASPSTVLYYFAATSLSKVTQAQYNELVSSSAATCVADTSQPQVGAVDVVTGGTNLGGCESPIPAGILSADGYWAISNGQPQDWEQDTVNGGADYCDHYTAAGCPAWCSYGYHRTTFYYYAKCTRPAGFYVSSGQLLGNKDATYTPSAIICSSSKVSWTPTSTIPFNKPATPTTFSWPSGAGLGPALMP